LANVSSSPGCRRWRKNMWVEIVLSIAPFPRNSSAPFVL
jgi:hypothetical protein